MATKYNLNIRSDGALDFLSLGALVHRLDPGIIPFRKATDCKIHVSGGEFNVAANLADCFRLQTGIATAMVDYPIGDLIAERVRAMGHEALVAPLLAVRPLEDAVVDLTGVAALAFTSANGVRAFAERSGERRLKVFAVGAATAQAAQAAGFSTVLSADGDVEALAEGIAARRNELRGVVLHPGASEPAAGPPDPQVSRALPGRVREDETRS